MKTVFFDPSFDWTGHPLWRQVWDAVEHADNLHATGYSPQSPEPKDTRRNKTLAESISRREPYRSVTLTQFMADDRTFSRAKQTAATMFRRENTYGQVREVDSEVIFLQRVLNWQKILRESGAHLVVFSVTPHFVDSFSLLTAAQVLGIQTLWFQPSSLAPAMMPRFSLEEVSDVAAWGKPSKTETATIDSCLRFHLGRAQMKAPKSYLERQAELDRSANRAIGKWRAIVSTAKWLAKGRFPDQEFPPKAYRLPRSLDHILQVMVPRISSKSLRGAFSRRHSKQIPSGHYALFALHYEPERTSVPEGGIESSQLEQIIKANTLVPRDMAFVVREHRSQLSAALSGYRGRSPFFYDLVVRDLGLILDYDAPLAEVVDKASVLFTGSGNMAVEAAMAGVPVVYFGFPWWAGMPGSYSYSEVSRLGLPIDSLTGSDPEAVSRFMRRRCLAEMLPGGASESQEELERRFGPLGTTFLEACGKSVASFIIHHVCTSL